VQHIHDQVKDHALEVAAAATGGAHLAAFKDRSIEKAIDEIGGELHSQYTISYTPAGSDATGYHEIKVNIVRNDAKKLEGPHPPGLLPRCARKLRSHLGLNNLLPEIGIARGKERVLACVPAQEMRRVGVLGVSLASSPHFVQQECARCVDRAVQIIAQAAFLSA